MSPVSALEPRDTWVRLGRSASSGGMAPTRRFLVRSSPVTRPSASVVTPCQASKGWLLSQLASVCQLSPSVALWSSARAMKSRESRPASEAVAVTTRAGAGEAVDAGVARATGVGIEPGVGAASGVGVGQREWALGRAVMARASGGVGTGTGPGVGMGVGVGVGVGSGVSVGVSSGGPHAERRAAAARQAAARRRARRERFGMGGL